MCTEPTPSEMALTTAVDSASPEDQATRIIGSTPNSAPAGADICWDNIRVATERSGLFCAIQFRIAMQWRTGTHFCKPNSSLKLSKCSRSDSQLIPPSAFQAAHMQLFHNSHQLGTWCSLARTPSSARLQLLPQAHRGKAIDIHKHEGMILPLVVH